MTALGVAIAVLMRRSDRLADIRDAAGAMADIWRHQYRAAVLFSGRVGGNRLYLGFSVLAFGSSPSAALVAAVFLGGLALGAASPTPAGLGVVEAPWWPDSWWAASRAGPPSPVSSPIVW
ncbi:hypothetical protein [Nocardia sp. NPDC005998]|uniref:hypothetical protein n=1 Tax=Nocardia sp. NPDC005998 TaxID=3156894 RepID=UPI0033A12585